VSDELDKLIPDPVDLPEKDAETDAPDAAQMAAAEAEGMSASVDPVEAIAPPVEPVPALPEQPPIEEVETPQAETQADEVAAVETPATEIPVAETPAEKPDRPAPPAPAAKPEEPKSDKMEWYILKVQSNREESIREALLRRVAIAGLERYFGDVIVPTEKVTEFKGGKKRIIKRKLYPGYIVVHMEINDDTWFLVRETPGIGDFTGAAGRPSVMLPHEVQRIVSKAEEKSEKAPKLKIGFSEGERVKIKEGTFENFEGDVESIDQTNGQVTVMINIFGRSTPVTLEYWQIETL
jgi:transcriptional antiterminator NusG